MDINRTNQDGAIVHGDNAGRDINKTEIYQNYSSGPTSQIANLLRKLDRQIKDDERTFQFIDDLQFFIDAREGQDIVGLKSKLEKVGRSSYYMSAIERKECFAKLLLRFENFSSAQELFAYFLSIIYDCFDSCIIPQVSNLSHADIEVIVDRDCVEKIISEMGAGFDHFTLNRTHVRGMIYWLADKCFVRWHE